MATHAWLHAWLHACLATCMATHAWLLAQIQKEWVQRYTHTRIRMTNAFVVENRQKTTTRIGFADNET